MQEITLDQWRQAERHGFAHVMRDGQPAVLQMGAGGGTELAPVRVVGYPVTIGDKIRAGVYVSLLVLVVLGLIAAAVIGVR